VYQNTAIVKEKNTMSKYDNLLGAKRSAVVSDDEYETSPGVKPTSATPLAGGEGAGNYLVGSGQSSSGQIAPTLPVSSAPVGSSDIPEYRPSVASNLPSQITAREIADAGAAFTNGRDGNVGLGAK
jgi:hypothetical protein